MPLTAAVLATRVCRAPWATLRIFRQGQVSWSSSSSIRCVPLLLRKRGCMRVILTGSFLDGAGEACIHSPVLRCYGPRVRVAVPTRGAHIVFIRQRVYGGAAGRRRRCAASPRADDKVRTLCGSCKPENVCHALNIHTHTHIQLGMQSLISRCAYNRCVLVCVDRMRPFVSVTATLGGCGARHTPARRKQVGTVPAWCSTCSTRSATPANREAVLARWRLATRQSKPRLG